jgi:hypothetical protein
LSHLVNKEIWWRPPDVSEARDLESLEVTFSPTRITPWCLSHRYLRTPSSPADNLHLQSGHMSLLSSVFSTHAPWKTCLHPRPRRHPGLQQLEANAALRLRIVVGDAPVGRHRLWQLQLHLHDDVWPRTPSSPAGRPSASSPSPSPCLLHRASPWPPTVHGSSPAIPVLPSASAPCPLPARLDKVRSDRHFPIAARISPSSASHHAVPPRTAPSLASHHAVVFVPPCE